MSNQGRSHKLSAFEAWTGESIGEITDWQEIKILEVLNQPTLFTVSIKERDTRALARQLAVQQVEVQLKENTIGQNSRLMATGYLRTLSEEFAGTTNLTFADAMWYILNRRVLDGTHAQDKFNPGDPNEGIWSVNDVNDGELMRDIIDYCQDQLQWIQDLIDADPEGGALLFERRSYGINTAGANTSTGTTTDAYEDDEVSSVFNKITQKLDGPDFHLTPEKVFNVYQRRGSNRTDFEVFSSAPPGGWPVSDEKIKFHFGNGGNIKKFNRTIDATEMITRTKLRSQVAVDEYGRTEPPDAFNTFEEYRTVQGNLDDATLVGIRLGLGIYNRPVQTYRITTVLNPDVDDSQYEVGDIVEVYANDVRDPVGVAARIHGREITINSKGSKRVTLNLSIYG